MRAAWSAAGNAGRGEVAHGFLRAEGRALKRSGQEAGAPVVRAGLRHAARVGNGDVGGQVLVLAAQCIRHPRAEAGKAIEREAGGEEVLGGAVRVGRAGERVDEGDFVRESGEVRNQVADPLAGPPVLAEGVLRAREISRRALERDGGTAGQRLVVPLD